MPILEQRLKLPAQPTSARRARRFVAAVLYQHGADSLAQICVLLTSELVTNAVLYARSDIDVKVSFPRAAVRIAVADKSRVQPVRRSPSATATSGRGLALVETLSSAWGVEQDGQGKEVWFEVRAGE